MLGTEYTRTMGAPAQELRADFFMDTVKDEYASQQAGRDIFKEVERVRVIIPGAVATINVKNVDDQVRQRWRETYMAWKNGQAAPVAGLVLEEWPVLNRAQCAELRHREIRTVEELARLSDVHVQGLGMGGMALRERARAYLDDAAHEAMLTKVTKENDVLASRIATLEQHNHALADRILELERQAVRGYTPPQDPAELLRTPYQSANEPAIRQDIVSALDSFSAGEERPVRASRHARDWDAPEVNFDPAATAAQRAADLTLADLSAR